jgi:hypothetical protein
MNRIVTEMPCSMKQAREQTAFTRREKLRTGGETPSFHRGAGAACALVLEEGGRERKDKWRWLLLVLPVN